jgi:Reverse transcriptase (RNA-dependent DNA polymerase)
MIWDIYPIPQITHILEQLQGKTLFTALDIHWGYNNIQIRPEDHHKAMFQTPYGLFQLNVMYFGLMNSPPTFQKIMDRLFCPLKDKYPGMLFVYMDDILIATTDNLVLSWLGSEATSKPSRAYSSQATELNSSGLEPAWLGDYTTWSRSSHYKPIDFPFLDMPTLNGNP